MAGRNIKETENYSKAVRDQLTKDDDWINLYFDFSLLKIQQEVKTPADIYEEFFDAVQKSGIFPDSKTFADSIGKSMPNEILKNFRKVCFLPDFDLPKFVHDNFDMPYVHESFYVSENTKGLKEHIESLWPILTKVSAKNIHSSILPLPHPFIVPGGRFGETYYWDSYFAMLGLVESGRPDLLKDMVDNFSWLIDKYGHIPNGNRTYYLSRSHPPVFSLMVELLEEEGIWDAKHYIEQLVKEYNYWMEGSDSLAPGEAQRHVVAMPDGTLLNRYWDERGTPREESWAEDIETAKLSTRASADVYRDIRAGAASGWDFSSRWLDESNHLSSIRTTSFIPIDLNAFLYNLERKISEIYSDLGKRSLSNQYRLKYIARRRGVNRYLWDKVAKVYRDYDWEKSKFGSFSAASVVPLYVGMCSVKRAHDTAHATRNLLLTPGGLLTSMFDTGEQWDKPNAWAPLQWMAVIGLNRYGEKNLAKEIGVGWLSTVSDFYNKHHKLVEKYDIGGGHGRPGGGGEYPLQDGFAWTNGVTYRLLEMYGSELNESS